VRGKLQRTYLRSRANLTLLIMQYNEALGIAVGKKMGSNLSNYVIILILPSFAVLAFLAIYADPKSVREEFLLSMFSNIMIGIFILGLGLFIIDRTIKD
jgi:hypothetical protein